MERDGGVHEYEGGRRRGRVDPRNENGGKNLVEKEKRGKELVGTKVEGRRPAMSTDRGGRRTRVSSTTQLAPAVPDSHLGALSPLQPPVPFDREGVRGGDPRGRERVRGWHAGEHETIPEGETIHQSTDRRARAHGDGYD